MSVVPPGVRFAAALLALLAGAGTALAASPATVATEAALRGAVADANATGGGRITVQPGTYALSAPLVVTSPITLVGPGRPEGDPGAAVLSGGGARRVLEVKAKGVSASGLVLTAGKADSGGAVVVRAGAGLTLEDSTVSASIATGDGGGVHNTGSLVLDAVTLRGNRAGAKGGGIDNHGTADVVNSTIDANTANGGGGAVSAATLRMRYVTVTRNVATSRYGGGLYRTGGTLSIEGSVVAGNRTSSSSVHDCYGSPTLVAVNLIGNLQGCGCSPKAGTLVTGDPSLGELADNGGPTTTREPGAGSAALDRVPGPVAGITADQRGVARPAGPGYDLGAVERSVLSASATLTAPETVRAGAAQIPLGAAAGAAASAAGPSSLAAAPLTSIAPGGDLGSTPLTSIPLTSIPLTSIPLTSIPLTSIPLSDVPLVGSGDYPAGWEDYLEGTDLAGRPLQTVTLGQALEVASPARPAPTLGEVDLTATPLTSIPLTSILLAPVPLTSIPLSPDLVGAGDAARLAEWCRLLGGQDACDRLGVDGQTTLISLALSGAPLTSIPLTSIPLTSIPLTSIPLTSIPLTSIPLTSIPLTSIDLQANPLTSIPLTSIPLTSIPLTSIPLTSIPLTSIPLTSIDLQANPLTSIPLTSIPLTSICPGCDPQDPAQGTLADAARLGLLRGTLGDLLLALAEDPENGVILGDVLEAAAASGAEEPAIADILRLLADSPAFAGLSLGDVLALLVPPADLPWQDVDVAALPLAELATLPSGVEDPRFDLVGRITLTGGPADVEARLTLPGGFSQAGAVRLRRAGETQDAALPACAGVGGTACATAAGAVVTVRVPGLGAGTHTVTVPARAGVELGPVSATLDVTAAAGVTAAATWDGEVVEAFELGGTPEDVLPVEPARLMVAHVGSLGDRDWYRFTAPAAEGTRAQIRLGNLHFDADLVLFGPAPEPLRGEPLRRLVGVEDRALGLDPLGARLPTETLADVPLALPWQPDLIPVNVSATRGVTAELVETAPLQPGQTYVIQVSGYNGATSRTPFSLQVRLDRPAVAACPAAGLPAADAGTLPAGLDVPGGTDTLVLVNEQRLAGAYGARGAAEVREALGRLAGAQGAAAGVTAAVIPVDGDGAVRDAYAAWDQAPCSPSKANGVVRGIGDLVDRLRAANPDAPLRYVVVVGDDTQIPMARVPDLAKLANERSFGAAAGRATAAGGAMERGFLLTDDPYGSDASIGVNGHELFVPARAVGRLVERPADIVASVEAFIASGGRLDPATAEREALVAGYDFLADGSDAVGDRLAGAAGGGVTRLINETWTRADLLDRLLPQGDGPDIASVNAHFDPSRALPALGSATGSEDDLLTTADLPAAGDTRLSGALLFSMGCHAGLSISDVAVGREVPDWARELAARRATWVANTGYGYGDTETVAVTERLMAGFAARLGDQATIGDALARAKREYLGDTPILGPYDEKAVQQATLYGLPMYRTGAAGGPAAPASPIALEDEPPAGGGPVTRGFTLDLGVGALGAGDDAVLHENVTPRGRFYDVADATLAVQDRPIQPRVSADVTPAATGRVAHGALITRLESLDLGAFDPVYFRPIVGEAAQEPERSVGDGVFPAAIQAVTGGGDPGAQRLVLVPGQFREPVAGTGIGTQRLFTRLGGEVLYSGDATDFTPPAIERVAVTGDRRVEVQTAGGAARVVALVRELGGLGRIPWTRLELTEGPAGTFRSDPLASAPVQYIVQAADGAGNVGVASNKGVGYQTGEQPPSEVGIALCQASAGGCDPIVQAPGDWAAGPVTASLSSPSGLPLFVSVDGEPFREYTGEVQITGDGVHTVQGRDAQGGTAAAEVRIDATAPSLDSALTPAPGPTGWAGGDVQVVLTAADGGSGPRTITLSATGAGAFAERTVAGATAGVTIGAEGVTTVTATARDAAGNATEVTRTVRIDRTAPDAPTVTGGSLDWQAVASVTVTATAADGGSGVEALEHRTSTDGGATWGEPAAGDSVAVTAEGETLVQFRAVDRADNASEWAPASPAAGSTVRIDRTAPDAPTVTGGSLDWQAVASVTVTATAADGGSGVAALEHRTSTDGGATWGEPAAGDSVAVTAEGETLVQFRAVDRADNASEWAPASPAAGSTVRIDRTAPDVTITTPAEGATYTRGSALNAAYACTDAAAGVASCAGPVPPGAALPTTTPGPATFTVTATDRAGNTASATARYAIAYRVCLEYDASKAGTIGSTFPIKVRLCDAAGRNLSSPGIRLTAVGLDAGSPTPNDAGSANPGFEFRYVAHGCYYIYNLKTAGLSAGPHVLRFIVGGADPPRYEAPFKLR